MRLRLSSIAERLRVSLFVWPMSAVVAAIVAAALTISIDRGLDSGAADLPLGFTSTVESARALLSTVAGATIAFAGSPSPSPCSSSNARRASTHPAWSTRCSATRSTSG
jgi:uncharacterized membrane protein